MIRHLPLAGLVCAALAGALVHAQTPAASPAAAVQKPVALPSGPVTPVAPQRLESNLLQLMRGMLYPASNVVFAAQGDLSKFPPDPKAPVSPNLLTSIFGGWEAIANSSLTLAESANVLLLPGRACANGNVPPIDRADWIKFTDQLREAGQAAYKASKTKSQDAMIDASEVVANSCNACHRVYRRDQRNDTSLRCIPPSQ
jgi:hypothetical protein